MTAPRPLCVHCRKPYGRRAIKTFMICTLRCALDYARQAWCAAKKKA